MLCAPKIARTRKFVCALAYGPEIVSTAFLDHCLENKEVPDLDEYELVDEEGEAKIGFELAESIELAKENKRRLLKGWQIFVTEKITGGFQTYKDIIEVNGGTCCMFKAKTNMGVAKNKLDGQSDEELFLVSGMSTEERKLWEPFKAMARKAEMVPRIVRSDWLLNVTMAQKIHWDDDWEYSQSR